MFFGETSSEARTISDSLAGAVGPAIRSPKLPLLTAYHECVNLSILWYDSDQMNRQGSRRDHKLNASPLTGSALSGGGAMSSICRTVPRDERWHARPPATQAILLDREWVGPQTAHHRQAFWRAIDDVGAGLAVVSSERCVAPLTCVA